MSLRWEEDVNDAAFTRWRRPVAERFAASRGRSESDALPGRRAPDPPSGT